MKRIFTFGCLFFSLFLWAKDQHINVDEGLEKFVTVADGGSLVLESQQTFEVKAPAGVLAKASKLYQATKSKPYSVKLKFRPLGIRQGKDLDFELKFGEELRQLRVHLVPAKRVAPTQRPKST